jgi:hypothetical protein
MDTLQGPPGTQTPGCAEIWSPEIQAYQWLRNAESRSPEQFQAVLEAVAMRLERLADECDQLPRDDGTEGRCWRLLAARLASVAEPR